MFLKGTIRFIHIFFLILDSKCGSQVVQSSISDLMATWGLNQTQTQDRTWNQKLKLKQRH